MARSDRPRLSCALSTSERKKGQFRYMSFRRGPSPSSSAPERGAQAEPAGQAVPALRPAEHPGDRPQVLDAVAGLPLRGPRADAQVRDQVDRRGLVEVADEAGVVVDELPIRAVAFLGGGRHGPRPFLARPLLRVGRVAQAGAQHRVDRLLEVAVRDLRVGVAREGDLALLRQPQPAVQRPGRLGHDRAAGGAAAAPDGAAPAVEQGQGHAGLPAGLGQRLLRAVELPVGGDEAAVLVAVRIPQHDLLPVSPGLQVLAVHGQREQLAHQARAAVQVVDRLEQRHHLQRALRLLALAAGLEQAVLLGEEQRRQHVADARRHRDDVDVPRFASQLGLRARDRGEQRQRLRGLGRPGRVRGDERAPVRQLAGEEGRALRLGQREVVRLHAGAPEHLRRRGRVGAAVLPEVEARELEAEDVEAPGEVAQRAVGQAARAARPQGLAQDADVAARSSVRA